MARTYDTAVPADLAPLFPARGQSEGLVYTAADHRLATAFVREFLGVPFPDEIERVAHFLHAVIAAERARATKAVASGGAA